jgi:hypothetical protein
MKISAAIPRAAGLVILLVGFVQAAMAQDVPVRYYRIFLRDKGTSARVLHPGEPLYDSAMVNLTPRALARRAKVLPSDSLVTTDDLPVYPAYLNAIRATGAQIAQTSRWLNTVMVLTDSLTYENIRLFPFVDSVETVRAHGSGPDPIGKLATPAGAYGAVPVTQAIANPGCLEGRYGFATAQNQFGRIDVANARGFAGEGILVGVLDAGFDWRKVAALRNAHVIAEYDFVNHDDYAGSDQPGEPVDPIEPVGWHGTIVSSTIGGFLPGRLVGGAPNVTFAFAKTENVFGEHNLEEDNFVAGLEWLEGLGVDVTNTSLGYTTFDPPEQGHTYEELNGHTAFGSRGLNHAVSLGVTCVVAAGNEAGSFNYVSVPAEADSAIAVAALNSDSSVASFSSRGFTGRTRIKPDVGALGVNVFGADARDSNLVSSARGTSLASPLVTAAAAVILSAAPDLTPYQLRTLLYQSSGKSDAPDTAVGYGAINVERALDLLSLTRPIVGTPQIFLRNDTLLISAWTQFLGTHIGGSQYNLELDIRRADGSGSTSIVRPQPISGVAEWMIPVTTGGLNLAAGDSISVEIRPPGSDPVRTFAARMTENFAMPLSTLCNDIPVDGTEPLLVTPNPTAGPAHFGFTLDKSASVKLVVYNPAGQEVDRLVDESTLDAGDYAVEWSPSGLASSAYFLSLTIDGKTSVQKLVLLHQ